MTTETPLSLISPELMARLEDAADKAAKGVRNRVEMAQACQRMDRVREEIHARHGNLNVAVPAIRELRDA